ncbi:MAG: tetratricopeptide repeat protein [Lachnospiraceae bacterium]|nr:tetratricopeptide repeat protein [Lachnospiraceae bacterium]
MVCYKCGCRLSEKNFCTGCGADVTLYKKIMYASNRFYNEALEKAQVRDLSGAIHCLRECLKLNKNHIEARNLLGLVYFERGEVVAALSEWVISKNIKSEKNIADDYINMIQNNPGRLETFNQTIKKYNQALAYCQQDSLDLAVIQLKKVLSMNPRLLQAHQLLALLYINSQEWERAKKELEKCLKIDTNNTTTLRYMKEVQAMMPSEEERGKKKKEAIVYQSGNDTVIQPIGKKDNAGVRTLLNIMLGVVIGVGVAWFLLLPAKVQNEQIKAQAEKNAISEQLDAKAVEVAEMTKQIESLMQEKSNLNVSLNEAQGVNAAVIASNDLMEASVMYLNKTGDEMQIAAIMEEITDEYLEKDATEEFIALYQVLLGEIGAKVAQTYYTTGYEALRTEEYETAIENLTKAFKYEPKNGEALFNLGNAYRKSGDEASAVSVYKQVVELFPDSEKAKKSQKYIEDIQGA